MRINATLVSVQSAKPAKNFGQLAVMPFKDGEKVGILRAAIPADVPDNAIVTKADLVFHTREAWSGGLDWTAIRQSEPWSVSKVTWTNRPATVVGGDVTTTVTSPSEGDEFRIDVSAHAQAFIAGTATNRGWRITTSAGSTRDLYGATAARRKPYLDLEYEVPGDAPTGLVPDGAAVSIAKPTLTFPAPDGTVAIRVQIDNDADGTSPVYDTNTAYPTGYPSTVGLFDLAASTYGGLADGATTYWRAQVKLPLGWTLWSDWATLTRVSKPTVTITSPGATTGDKTPPITWTAAGQVTWRARLLKPDGTELDDSDLTTSDDLEWVPEKGLKRVGDQGVAHVRVWDDVDRVATPGDPIYAEAFHTFELVAIDDAPGADQITASQDGPSPVVRVAWDGAVPDNWQMTRDGEWIGDRMEGAVFEYLDHGAAPYTQHVYQVLAVTDDGQASPNGPTATVTPRPAGAWLLDPDTDERILLLNDEIVVTMTERAVLHTPIGDGAPIRRRSGTPPPSGTAVGFLTTNLAGDDYDAATMAATALSFKDSRQSRVYRLAWGTWNIPVTIGDMTVAPSVDDSGQPGFEVGFSWWQTNDELRGTEDQMQPLGLNRRELTAYHTALLAPHDFRIDVDILDMEEKHVGSVKAIRSNRDGMGFLDGQVNIQRQGVVKRTATLTFYDPDHALHLDQDSVFAGAVFADRIIRVRHTIHVTGVGNVTATPFVGPVVKPNRKGDILTVECQDKTLLAMEGVPHKTVKKGRNAVEAIEEIMRDCTGERRFRFPKNSKARLSRSYSVGWKADAAPWRVCQKIANQINMQLIYACDGALMLRKRPRKPLLELDDDIALTDAPSADYDITGIRNIVRVTGEQNKKKNIHIAAVARPKATHPHSPESLGRHGVPRYLPELIDDGGIRKTSKAKDRAQDVLQDRLPMGVTASFPAAPYFHLDYSDPIRIRSEWGGVTVPFIEGSIPLGLAGDAEYGAQRRVSRPRRRG